MSNKTKKQAHSQTAVKEKHPPLYAVIILNDDYTPMVFVVHVLITFFQKTEEKAKRITLSVHKKGKGVCGKYSKEIAETKASQVVQYAQSKSFPLQCTIERLGSP